MVIVGRYSRVSFPVGSALIGLFASSFAACESYCPQADPPCPEGSDEVAECSSDDCVTLETCSGEKFCEPSASCNAMPSCAFGENEVPSCDTAASECQPVTVCGSTIFCETPPPCEAVPTCDEGDEEQPSSVCPDDASCYTVELCTTSILCLDNGLAHGCPPEPPLENEPCPYQVVCEYPVEPDCVETWSCDAMGGRAAPIVTYAWHSGGTVCADPPN